MSGVWNADDIADQRGRVAVITGANTGIGFHTAAQLAAKGAHVVLAVRNVTKGHEAVRRIHARGADGEVRVVELDLASLDSIGKAADILTEQLPRLDILINNAGVMWTPKTLTADGFEMQFGTNHLGHFALTGHLMDKLLATQNSRIVTVSSLAHSQNGPIEFTDLNCHGHYDPELAYSRSKLANLLFTYELQRRFQTANATTVAVAAHPGVSNTDLGRTFPLWARGAMVLLGQPADKGALPTLRAATDSGVRGGDYFGPARLRQSRGYPTLVRSSRRSHDAQLQRQLWQISEDLTGVRYPI